MGRIFFFALLVFFYPARTSGQQGRYDCGAANFGIADASVAISNEWAAFHNIAGISAVQQVAASFAYIHRYQLRPLQTMAASIVVPVGRSVCLSGGIFRFGDKLFNEQKVSLGFASSIGFVRLGAQVHYTQIHVETVGQEGLLLVDLGGIVELGPRLSLAGHIFNASATAYRRFLEHPFPVIMTAGLSYRPVEEINICLEVEKDMDRPFNTKAGLEYVFYERVPVRAGFSLEPSALFFGTGFRSQRIAVDYGLSHHHLLGYSHQGSCTFMITR